MCHVDVLGCRKSLVQSNSNSEEMIRGVREVICRMTEKSGMAVLWWHRRLPQLQLSPILRHCQCCRNIGLTVVVTGGMELLTQWWKSPLAEDHHTWLRTKEQTCLPKFQCQPVQRLAIIDWIAVICDESHVCLTARHLAVILLDYFLDRHDVEEPQLKLVALCSLHIAAKFEECETNVPKISELNRLANVNPGYTSRQFLAVELLMLEFFGWSINLPTAAHFYDYYLVDAVTSRDFYNSKCLGDEAEAATESLAKFVVYFLEVSLQDQTYRNYLPSCICAASIAATRQCLRILPVWPVRLQERTGYLWSELQPLVQKMMKAHTRDELQQKSTSPVKEQSEVTALFHNECHLASAAPVVYFLAPVASYCGVFASNKYFVMPS